jgi:hypothetical protein
VTELELAPAVRVKVRSPVWVIVFSTISLYLYVIYWWYAVNREMRDLGRLHGAEEELGRSPGRSALAISLGGLLIVPPFVSVYRGGQRIQAAQHLVGRTEIMNGWIATVLYVAAALVFIPFATGYFQSELNKVWESAGGSQVPDPHFDGPAPPRGWSGPGSISSGSSG